MARVSAAWCFAFMVVIFYFAAGPHPAACNVSIARGAPPPLARSLARSRSREPQALRLDRSRRWLATTVRSVSMTFVRPGLLWFKLHVVNLNAHTRWKAWRRCLRRRLVRLAAHRGVSAQPACGGHVALRPRRRSHAREPGQVRPRGARRAHHDKLRRAARVTRRRHR